MSRWKASGLHLLFSSLVIAVVVIGMLYSWFPLRYFQASAAGKLLFILVSVNLVAGPLLTLLIYRVGKKGLKFDLWVIGVVQLATLLYGLHVMWLARPVFLVFAVDRFNLVFADQIPQSDVVRAPVKAFRSLSWNGPKLVFARIPDDPDARSELLINAIDHGRDIETMPAYFEPIANGTEEILAAGFSLDDQVPATVQLQFERLAEQNGQSLDSMIGLPLIARGEPKTLVLDRKSGSPLGVVEYNRWLADDR